MSAIHLIVLSLLVCYSHQPIADTRTTLIDIGGVAIVIPSPEGFHEISQLSPNTLELAESVTPPAHRLLAAFISENDVHRITEGESPEMKRYILLQVHRKLEHSNVSDYQFSQLVDQQKLNVLLMEEKRGEADTWINSLLNNAAESISKKHSATMNFEIGEPLPLEILLDQSNAFGLSQLIKMRISVEGKPVDTLVIGSLSFVKVTGKILVVLVNSKYETKEDLEWLRTNSVRWVNQILATNISQAPSNQSPYQPPSLTSSDWSRVIKKGTDSGKGAIVLGLLSGLVILILIALKKLCGNKK